jgi:hypothetical protein
MSPKVFQKVTNPHIHSQFFQLNQTLIAKFSFAEFEAKVRIYCPGWEGRLWINQGRSE